MKTLTYTLLLSFMLILAGCANAGKDQTVNANTIVTLDASASTPSMEGTITKYQWKQIRGTKITLSDANAISPTFMAPNVTKRTRLVFRLVTTETGGTRSIFRSRDYVRIIVLPSDNTPPNNAPVAYAEASAIEIDTGESVEFDASNSTDSDGSIVSYEWKLNGSAHVLNDTLNFTYTFETAGTYSVILTVTDDDNATDTSELNIQVNEVITGQTVSGVVTDANGSAISGALVSIGDKNATTNAQGMYAITNIEATQRASIDVSHPNYFANSRIIVVNENDVEMDITLDTPEASLTFSSLTGGTVEESSGASVALPAEGYIDANGIPYTGDVVAKMNYHPITTVSGRAAFPGSFEGIEGNETFPIQSYGFMNVELSDPQGNALNLDGNSSATLTYPIDYTLSYPSTIPLWYYDEALGYWVQEGEATRTNDYTSYVGTVTHFTSWNLDAKGPRAQLTGCVEDSNGNPVAVAYVQFRSTNWDSYVVPTDENGSISVYNILAQADLTFSATAKIGNALYYGEYPTSINLTEGENRVLSNCIVLTEQINLPGTITVTGVLTSEFPISPNETVNIYSSTGDGSIIASGTSNPDHTFSITFQTVDALNYLVVGGNYGTTSFTLQPNKSTYNVIVNIAPAPAY